MMKLFILSLLLTIFNLSKSQNYQSIANNHNYWDLNFVGERNFSINDTTLICLKLQKFRCFDDSLHLKWEYRDESKGNCIGTNIVKDEEGFSFITKSRAKATNPKSKINIIKLDYNGNEIYKKTITNFNPFRLYQFKDKYIFLSKDAIGIIKDDQFIKVNFPEDKDRFYVQERVQIQDKIYLLAYNYFNDIESLELLVFDISSESFTEFEVPLLEKLAKVEMVSVSESLYISSLHENSESKNAILKVNKFNGSGFEEIFRDKKNIELSFIGLYSQENGNIFIATQEENNFEDAEYSSYEKEVEKGNIYYYILDKEGKALKEGEVLRKSIWSLALKNYNGGLGMSKATIADPSDRSERFTSVSCLIDGNKAFFTLPVGRNLSIVVVSEEDEEKITANILKRADETQFNKIYLSPNLSFKTPGSDIFGFIFSNPVTPNLVDLTNKLYLVNLE